MEENNKKERAVLKLFEEVDSDCLSEIGSELETDSDSETSDPFCDDGTFGDDPDYDPGQLEEESEDGQSEEDMLQEIIQEFQPTEAGNTNGQDSLDKVRIPEFPFNTFTSGIQIDVTNDSSPRQIFDQLFSNNIVELLVNSINAYAENMCASNKPKTRSSVKLCFRKVCEAELMKFFGLCLLQGEDPCPTIRQRFSNHPLHFNPIFPFTMSGRRFQQILRCLNCHYLDTTETGKLQKVAPLLNPLLRNFQNAFSPEKELSLDESLLLFRGRLSFRQYMKGKKAKYGIKFFELTAASGYVLNLEIYQGKTESLEQTSKTGDLVLRLMKKYLNKGHHLYMDNFYNSFELSKTLLDYSTHTTGTLRFNRKGIPKEIKSAKLKKGEHIWRRIEQTYVSKWKDKRDVLTITTGFHPELVSSKNRFGKESLKPNDVVHYNRFMSGIDRCDQMVAYYSSPRKTIRWYKKVIFHLLDISVWNAYFLYQKSHQKQMVFLDFRDNLITSLIQLPVDIVCGADLVRNIPKRGRPRGANNLQPTLPSSPSLASSSWTQEQHFIEKIPAPQGYKRKSYFLRCSRCTMLKLRKETKYRCKTCPKKPALCAECFEPFHNN